MTMIITGATDGIGHMLAKRYACEGRRLVLVGRRPMGELDVSLRRSPCFCTAIGECLVGAPQQLPPA